MSILPESAELQTDIRYVAQPTRTFLIDRNSNQIRGMDAGLRAMRQAVEIILNVERYAWQIYTANFGSELQILPGEDAAYIEAELPRRIEDAFSADSRILGTDDWVIKDNGDGTMYASFTVQTVFGVLPEVLNL